MKYFSLFSGIGGVELGIQQSNVYQPECVGYSEIDKYAIQIYQKHFPTHKNYGDTTTIKTKELPDFDWLVGGFPCQAFSIAGKRKGFNDTRGTLFFEIARILRDKRPSHFLLENVKGLLSHDFGKTFQTIIRVLTDLGYQVEWQVLNSKNFGVPQNRERVFIIGHLGGECGQKVFPIGESSERTIQKREKNKGQTYSWALRGRDYKDGTNFIIGGLQKHQTPRKDGISPCLPEAMGKGGGHTPIVNSIRRLTPTECERLQGFPDGWTKKGIDINGNEVVISDTQRYKTLGNAITTCVVKEIMLHLII